MLKTDQDSNEGVNRESEGKEKADDRPVGLEVSLNQVTTRKSCGAPVVRVDSREVSTDTLIASTHVPPFAGSISKHLPGVVF